MDGDDLLAGALSPQMSTVPVAVGDGENLLLDARMAGESPTMRSSPTRPAGVPPVRVVVHTAFSAGRSARAPDGPLTAMMSSSPRRVW